MLKKGFIVCVPTIVRNYEQPKTIQNTFYEMKIKTLIEIHLIFILLHPRTILTALYEVSKSVEEKSFEWELYKMWNMKCPTRECFCFRVLSTSMWLDKFSSSEKNTNFGLLKSQWQKEWWKSTTKFSAFLWEPNLKNKKIVVLKRNSYSNLVSFDLQRNLAKSQ